ncbi:hypothetical protein FE391_19875 [Nonomuraea sp. KC401]|uniref:hypothetical protein n=1 Tax=unclassified Nonomuraea TaxID=2593643 RepID=UPI0010FEC5E8|nr:MULTISPECIES: hypothetical protein [unclassified Nonomuraea]NBE96139.1 hypothetical protein [Nonomuraea sp. K271]TLF71217.1 hypothetical protein FE391_19875 [Nonomuraea sp. KC401]
MIETGNHIAQLSDGRLRRLYAGKLAELLESVIDGKAPWVLHTVEWGVTSCHLSSPEPAQVFR